MIVVRHPQLILFFNSKHPIKVKSITLKMEKSCQTEHRLFTIRQEYG